MAKKPDLSAAKEFLFNHGEKVALGVCAFIAIVLGGLKLWGSASAGYAPDSGEPWKIAFDKAQSNLSSQIASVQKPKFDAKGLDPDSLKWKEIETKFEQARYLEIPESADDKRRNPMPLKILADPSKMQIDYVRALTLVHDYSTETGNLSCVVPVAGAVGPAGANPMGQPPMVPMAGMGKGPRKKVRPKRSPSPSA